MADRKPIFISYRRGDEPGYTGWLYQLIADALGPEAVFKDIEGGFKDGDDFPVELASRIADSDIVLAVIGPGWLDAADEAGRRRLDNRDDWVRVEIASALGLAKRVIPVLVNGAGYPRAEDLPEDLAPLARKQVRRLTVERFGPDAQVLIAGLPDLIAQAEAERQDAALKAAEDEKRRQEEAARQAAEDLARQRQEAEVAPQASLSDADREELRAMSNWVHISARDDTDALRDHISRFPNDETAGFAKVKLEELIWSATERTERHLTAYLDEFGSGPNPDNIVSAKAWLADLHDQRAEIERQHQAEQDAFSDLNLTDRRAIKAFLKAYPDGQNANTARAALKNLGGLTRRAVMIGGSVGVLGGLGAWQMQPGEGLWSLINDQSDRVFRGHENPVSSVALSLDGAQALSAAGAEIFLWDIGTGNKQRLPSTGNATVYVVLFSPDGKTALSTRRGGFLDFWDLKTQETLKTFASGEFNIVSAMYTPDGRSVLTGTVPTLRLWSVASGKKLRTFSGHDNWVRALDIDRQGRLAVSGSDDGSVRLWKISNGKAVRTVFQSPRPVLSVAFAPNSESVAAGGSDGVLRLWDVATGNQQRLFEGHQGSIGSIAFTPNGEGLLTGSDDMSLRLWRTSDGTTANTFYGHTDGVTSVAVAPDGTFALSGGRDGALRMWDLSRYV